MKNFFLHCFILILFNQNVNAQSNNDRSLPKPKVLLVMLHLSTNKIEALKKRNMEEVILQVIQSDEEINNSIMRDFSKNFTFCPVYFFYDTCYEKAKAKQWEDITFYDYESINVKKKITTQHFSDYYFAEIGYRSPGSQLDIDTVGRNRDQYRGEEDHVATMNYGVNLYDEDFNPIKGKLGFTDISLRPRGPLFGAKKMVFEGATEFNEKLRSKFSSYAK